ncbi:iron ABC transporter permease [Phototrophicus methaneseepsis]|uniref:Iron ABC transporter permease n=1 Tax=Phototrophicus methaneseepsis TaxID=2710758 RepID=A0A7S8IGY3_9CHLR|nr:iron ABC transporter permease [Phototrophicus methaneseepsis]
MLLVPVLFLGIFFVYPLVSIFDLSLRPDGVLDLSGFLRLATSDYYRDTLWFTLLQASLSTLLTIILAIPGAYVFVHYRFPGRSLLMSLMTLPFVLPTVVVAAAFLALIGPRGLLNTTLMTWFGLETAPIQLTQTLTLILIVHVFYNYAVALRMIAGYWAGLSARIEDAARTLGAHGWRLWWYVRLPMLRPAITSAALLVFIFTFTSFGVVLILGGIRFATLEVQIYYQARNLLNLPMAAALSLVQIGIMLVMMIVYTRLQQRMTSASTRAPIQPNRPSTTKDWLLLGGNLLFMALMLVMPLLALVLRAITVDGQFSLAYFTGLSMNPRDSILFVPPAVAVRNSLFFAGITTVFALLLGTITAYLIGSRTLPRWIGAVFDPLFMLPLATSAVTLGFGFIIALDEPPLDLRSSWVLIPIAHTLVAMPFVVRSVLPALRNIPASVQEAAQVLGASPWQVWRWIDLPLLSRGLVVGATFAFAVSMGEFGASVFVARPDTPTMPVVIFRLLGQPGAENYGQALALSTLLLLVCLSSFVAIERFRDIGVGEF